MMVKGVVVMMVRIVVITMMIIIMKTMGMIMVMVIIANTCVMFAICRHSSMSFMHILNHLVLIATI